VDQSRCAACRQCPPMEICPGRVVERIPETARVQITTLDRCYSCLACVTVCPLDAIWSD
jgi:Pyruvate/2-oxoacid:ferredoxin oxidoreductase delta subunit